MIENPDGTFSFDDENQVDNDTRNSLFSQYYYNNAVPKAYAKDVIPKKHNWGSNGVCIDCHLTIAEYNRLNPLYKDWACGTFHRLCVRTEYCKNCGLSKQYIHSKWPDSLRCPGIIEINEEAPLLFL